MHVLRAPALGSILAGALTLLAACGGSADTLSPEAARSELTDRNWIDRWPEAHGDRLHVYRFTPSMGGGVYQDRTVFEGSFELFTFEATGDQIRFVFPAKSERAQTGYRIERVDGPAPFTRKRVLDDDPRGPGVYYGWDEHQQAAPFGL